MQQWSPDGTRQERTGWRDASISERHRHWGMNCPAVDLDFLMVEYNIGKPVALVEYKHYHARVPNLLHPTYRALRLLADNYAGDPLPFLVAFYWPGIWAFRVLPANDISSRHFHTNEHVCELDFVSRLYRMRRLVLAAHLANTLSTELPSEAAA